jgi:hypothetical protein
MKMESFVIELCYGSRVVEFQEFTTVKSARERLNTQMAHGYWLRLNPPDPTGFIPGDDKRYARQCDQLGIENFYD